MGWWPESGAREAALRWRTRMTGRSPSPCPRSTTAGFRFHGRLLVSSVFVSHGSVASKGVVPRQTLNVQANPFLSRLPGIVSVIRNEGLLVVGVPPSTLTSVQTLPGAGVNPSQAPAGGASVRNDDVSNSPFSVPAALTSVFAFCPKVVVADPEQPEPLQTARSSTTLKKPAERRDGAEGGLQAVAVRHLVHVEVREGRDAVRRRRLR